MTSTNSTLDIIRRICRSTLPISTSTMVVFLMFPRSASAGRFRRPRRRGVVTYFFPVSLNTLDHLESYHPVYCELCLVFHVGRKFWPHLDLHEPILVEILGASRQQFCKKKFESNSSDWNTVLSYAPMSNGKA